MAMLAEPRRKQKWTLNPRGKQWSNDSSKFGQKMLEKMGWTSGKGLGVNEQGMKEHVRVKLKDDRAGFGFSIDDQNKLWNEHHEGYEELLQNLQNTSDKIETNDSNLSGKSLELKSKQSRARVHYHKFTRGKDVNRYSSKDLANIFGKKELPELPPIETNNDESADVSKNLDEPMQDDNLNSVVIQDTENDTCNIIADTAIKHKKKKKKRKIREEPEIVNLADEDSNGNSSDDVKEIYVEVVDNVKLKKKKKSSRKEKKIDEVSTDVKVLKKIKIKDENEVEKNSNDHVKTSKKKSKSLVKSSNLVLDFPGSNINDICGYGEDL